MSNGSIKPIERFWLLLKPKDKEIRQIYTLSLFSGLVALSLPLGIQAIINLIQGGEISTSFIVLVIIVVLGVSLAGVMQIMQLRITENLQQTLFAQAAFDFALRVPNIKAEELYKRYAPEVMNRFFDITNVQKGLSKILIDFSTATLQIVFGLTLLSLYHPLFIILSISVVFIIYAILKYTGKKGLETSILESNQKFRVAYWLQEIARAHTTFKLAGKTNLPATETDKRTEQYLIARENHFIILRQQMIMLIGFKVFVAAALLIIGGILVINQQMNIGQFVAAELIILLVLGSVEKIILCLETIYDVLTSLEKIGQVSDLKLESNNNSENFYSERPLAVELIDVSFSYPMSQNLTLEHINISVKSGEKICITGDNGSGKSTLMKLLSSQYEIKQGTLCINNLPLNNFNPDSIKNHIGTCINDETIFNGTIADNISLGRDNISTDEIMQLAEKMYLADFIKKLPEGLNTKVYSDGQLLPKSIIQKLLLTRSLAGKPKLLLLEDCFESIKKEEREKIINYLLSNEMQCTIIAVCSEPYYMSNCSKTYVIKDGKIIR
jgi:ABC-type bacteriocin/lantibiotic exporter with double-glycine peptidase domain